MSAQASPNPKEPVADYEKHENIDLANRVGSSDIATGAWSTGLFSCFDVLVPNCLMVWLCPWVSLSQIASRLGLAPYPKALAGFFGLFIVLVIFNALAAVSSFFSFMTIVVALVYLYAVWFMRQKVRERFQIPGCKVRDAMLSLCCGCCSVAQMATHIKSYTPGSCDFGPVDTLPSYDSVDASA